MENEMKALYETVVSRKTHAEEGSYTAYLYEKGLEKILKTAMMKWSMRSAISSIICS